MTTQPDTSSECGVAELNTYADIVRIIDEDGNIRFVLDPADAIALHDFLTQHLDDLRGAARRERITRGLVRVAHLIAGGHLPVGVGIHVNEFTDAQPIEVGAAPQHIDPLAEHLGVDVERERIGWKDSHDRLVVQVDDAVVVTAEVQRATAEAA